MVKGMVQEKRVLNPGTEVYMEENSQMEMEMVQIKGVDSTIRTNTAKLAAGARLVDKRAPSDSWRTGGRKHL